jgi:hypothetical protein
LKKLASVAAVLVAALAVVAGASADDCMRVSSSLQGLQQSTASGNWLAFDMTDGGGGVAAIVGFAGLPESTVPCFQAAYDASNGPRYFALGIGVAGARAGNGPQVLAHNAPDGILQNGTGIDHFDDVVLPIFLNALPTCAGA